MNQEEIQKSILERFENLQPEIQNIILNENYDKEILNIGEKYNLTDKQKSDLEFNTTLILLGQTHPNDFKNELIEDLGLPETSVNTIINEINEKILKDVLPIIKQNFIEDNNETEEQREDILKNATQKIYDIAQKYKLPIDKMGIVDELTKKFLSGEISSTQYENRLSLDTDLPPTKVTEMVRDINENIIKGVREEMKENINSKQGAISSEEKINSVEQTENNIDKIPLPPKEDKVPSNLPIMENKSKESDPELEIEEMPLELEEGENIPLPPKEQKVEVAKPATEDKKPEIINKGVDIKQQIESIIKDSNINLAQQVPAKKPEQENKTETQAKIFKDSGIEILPQDEIPSKKVEDQTPKVVNNLQTENHKHDPYREEI